MVCRSMKSLTFYNLSPTMRPPRPRRCVSNRFHTVITFIPVHELFDTFFHVGFGKEAKIVAGRPDIRRRLKNIPGMHRSVTDLCFLAGIFLPQTDAVHE